MRDKPGRPGHGGRTTLSAVAMVLVLALTPAGTGYKQATISWSKIWHWLTGHSTSLVFPAQHSGTAAGKPHYVPADATRAVGGTGRVPGRGAGQLPPFTVHAPKIAPRASGRGFGNGSHSFSARTSRRVAAESSATSTLFRNADGTYTKVVYAGPVNYRAADGGWQPIGTALRREADGRYQEAANSFAVSLAPWADGQDLIAARFGAATLAYGLRGAARVPARVSGSTATYAGVLPGTSLVLSARATGLEESLVLAGPSAPSSWTFPLRLRGLTARPGADGSVEFVTAAGVVVARIPRGYLRDSSAHRGSGGPAVSRAISYQLVSVDGQPALRMTASQSWLRDPARVFPVTVDPNFTASGTTEVDNLYPGDSSSMPDIDIGSYDYGAEESNGYLAFSGLGSALSGEHVTSAYLHVFDYWASTCTPEQFSVSPVTQSWSVTGSKSWPGPSFGGAIGSLTANPGSACTNTGANETIGTWMTVGLSTGTFNSWTTGGADNGLALSAADNSNVSWKRFSSDNGPNPPYLELNFTPDVPPQIDSQYPPDNYASPTLTPELIATGHDPDNWPDPVQYLFTVYTSSGATVASSGLTGSPDWVVPAGKLSWSQTYYWAVQDYDGYDYSSSASTSYFTTTVPQPLITSSLAQNSDGHGFDPSVGNYTTSATDANVQTAGPLLSVQRDYNSLDPRVSGAFGAGWSTVYDMKATEVDDASGNVTSVVVTYPDGSEVGFGENADGNFASSNGRFATLKAITGPIIAGDDTADCVDVNGGSSAPGTKVQMWGCDGSVSAQTWTMESNGTVRINGQCLDITGGTYSDGALIEEWTCNGGANQQWTAVNGELVNPASAKCLDDPNSNTAQGTQLDLWTCNGGTNQRWSAPAKGYTLTDKSGTVYTFSQPTSAGNAFAVSSIADYFKRTETFSYTSGELATVQSGVSGRALHFTWSTPAGAQYPHVASVTTDPAAPGATSTALTWTYTYSGDELTGVCPPTSPTQCTGYSYTAGSDFPSAVLDAGPHSYWRMDDAPGRTAASAVTVNEGSDNGTYSNVTLGQPGPLPGSAGTSASFDGTSSYLSLPQNLVFQSSYATVSMWFKTAATSAGTLFSTGHSAPGTANPSGAAMPVLYVGSDGKLHGHFWDGTVPGMTSAAPVNDGKWHLVVLTSAGNTQDLYLDGQQIGSESGQIDNVDPYDMIGTGVFNNNGWPAAPSGNVWNYFDGQISDAAFFTHYLTNSQITALYATGHSAANLLSQITTPDGNTQAKIGYDAVTGRVRSVTDAHGGTWTLGTPSVTGSSQVFRSAVLGAAPAGYWRLGDAGPAAQADDEVNAGYGQYSNVTLGVAGPFQDETAAQFNGTSSAVGLPDNLVESLTSASVGLWFKTTSASAGMLFSTGHSEPGTPNPSSAAMPVLYVGSDGKLYGHFWDGNFAGIASPGKVNDGNWHFVVLTGSGGTQYLYLDGQQIGSQSGGLTNVDPQDMVGTGVFSSSGWTAAPDNNAWNYFNGSIGEVAVYRSALSAAQVGAQWAAYKSSSGIAPAETITVTDPGGKTITYRYDPDNGNRILSRTDALGDTTSYGYDTSGYLYTVTDPDGDVTTTGHDVRGNVVSKTTCQEQAANKCSTQYYTYYPDDTSATLTPDPRNDLVLTMRDGRSANSSDPGYLTSYAYDASGNQVSLTTPPVAGFPSGRTTTLAYTTSTTPAADSGDAPAGLLASVTSPGGGTETLTYYADGDVASITDPAGEQTKYDYDGLGRATSKTVVSSAYPAGLTTTYTYNRAGQVLTETDPAVTDHVTGAVHTAQTTNAYDADGNLTSVTVADLTGGDSPRTTTYQYAADELVSQTDPAGAVTSYVYDAYGNKVKQVDPAGNETDYAYDADGHLLSTTLTGYTGDPANPSPAVNLVQESRAYDPAGRLASVTDSMGNVTSYTYTDDGLLATVTRSDPATGQSFTEESDGYDAAGNLIQKVTNNGFTTTTYAVDAADRTVSSTLDPAGLDRTTTYSYSPDDFVLNVRHTDGAGDMAATDYNYDSLGRMTSQTVHDDSPGSPAGWWPLNGPQPGGVYTPDQSGSGNTAILHGGVTFTALCPLTTPIAPTCPSGALFDGSTGAMSLPDDMVQSQSALSVSLWFQTTATTAGMLFSTGHSEPGTANPSSAAMPVLYVGTDGKLHGHFWNSAGNVSGMTSAGAVNDGAWHHVVLTGSGSGQVLYVDGAQAGTLSGALNNVDPLNMIGAGVFSSSGWPAAPSGNTWSYFSGRIRNVQIYDRALTAPDVAALYSAGSAGQPPATRLLTTTWSLDSRGLPKSMTNPDGNATYYLYDEAGKLAQVTDPAVSTESNGGSPVNTAPVTTYGYDTFGDRVSVQDPDGNVTATGYDADGRAVSQTLPGYTPPGASSPITATSTRNYNALGQLVSATDPLGNATKYTYDQLGDTATVTNPQGGVTHYTYDTGGDQLSVTNPAGALSQATYDFLGRKLTSTQGVRQPSAAAYTTTYAYADTPGLLSSVTTPAGVVTSDAYDAAGERTRVTDGAGNVTRYGYDLLGRQTSSTAPDGTSQHVAYDEAGFQVRSYQDDASGNTLRSTSAAYDPAGNMTSQTDAMGGTTQFSYDATGLLTSETQPVSATSAITTSFGYDAAGNMTRYTDGNGNNTIFTYDTWNLRESTIVPATPSYPDSQDRTFTTAYNADGQPAQVSAPGGVTATYGYDALGRLVSQSGSGADAPTATRTFGYDAAGDLTTASTPSGTDKFNYDDRGLLLSASGPSGSSSFSYTPDGQLASSSDASGTTSYGYDSAGRLGTLTDGATSTAATYGYNTDSQVSSIHYGAGGATQTFSYNSLHELTGDTLNSPSGQSEASISYGYNLNGDETSKTTTGFAGAASNTYTYDEANRLSSWNNGTATVTYAYDGDGNRTSVGAQTFTYDARDELTSGAGTNYTYTARGTIASVTSASGTVTSTSDAFNEVVTDGSQTYSHDALGRVLTAAGRTFAYSGVTNNLASDGTATYTRDPSGGLVAVAAGGTSVLALTDQHQDVVGEFTATGGALTGSATYDPFGNVTAAAGLAGNLGYQSGWTDPSTGKVNMASRWYNPATGQFTSRDAAVNSPVPDSVTANTFAYGNDNPLTAFDPLGTCDWWNVVCGVQQVASNIGTAVSNAWNASGAASAWNSGNPLGALGDFTGYSFHAAANWVYQQASQAVTNLVASASHVVSAAVSVVQDGWQWVQNARNSAGQWVNNASQTVTHWVYEGGKAVLQSGPMHVVYAAYQAVKTSPVGQFVQHHAAAIVSFVASTAVFMGCEAVLGVATAGVGAVAGAVACGALSGAVGGAINYAMSTPMNKWTVGGFAMQTGLGALSGAAGSLLGSFGSKLLGPVFQGVAARLGAAAADDGASALADAGSSLLDDASGDVGGAGGDPGASPSTDANPSTSAEPTSAEVGSAQPSTTAEPSSAEPSPAEENPAPSCGGESFSASTRVLTASGALVPISQLVKGDKVLAANTKTGKNQAEPVAAVLVRHDTDLYRVKVRSGGVMAVIDTTSNHLFWVSGAHRWVKAAALRNGTHLRTSADADAVVTGGYIPARHDGWMWDLTVTADHDFYVLPAAADRVTGSHVYYVAADAPVLVHNYCNTTQVAYGSTDLSKVVQQARISDGNAGNNYAALFYQQADGTEGTIVAHSYGGVVNHAERQLIEGARALGIQDSEIQSLYTEFQPCQSQCGGIRWLDSPSLRHVDVTFSWLWDKSGSTIAAASTLARNNAVSALLKAGEVGLY
jgi:RHS repeat-associated protein